MSSPVAANFPPNAVRTVHMAASCFLSKMQKPTLYNLAVSLLYVIEFRNMHHVNII